jgi:AGZA family xanthine/uracil permease-like MFS transporter
MSAKPFRYPVWVRGDLDGFFGLMVDNLVQVLLIIALCKFAAGLPDFLIYHRILPGVAISLLIGNLFYGLQAHRVARRTRNPNTTALPYGINTPTVIAFALFIMEPVYRATGDSTLAYYAGLLACLVSGVIEFFGAFFAERIRRVTPRAALLGVLAAIGIAFIAADFSYRIFTSPLVGLLPLAFLLLAYFAKYRFPLGLPGGFLAVLFGTLIAWGTTAVGWDWFGGVRMSGGAVREALGQVAWIAPGLVGRDLLDLLWRDPELLLRFLTVSIPMGYMNVLGSLQNIESAAAGGDRYATGPSLAVNGLGTIAAGLFGSCFPTTIYIGHPGWKALGAKAGYSILNGLFFTAFFLFGLGPFLQALIPIEAGAAIVLYIGILITAQAFQATPQAHAPAVAIALFPVLAAVLIIGFTGYLPAAGATRTLADLLLDPNAAPATIYLPGLLALNGANSGWILVTLFLTAIGAALVDRKYRAAAIWAGVAAVFTLVGAMHAYRLEGNVVHEYFIWQRAECVHVPAPAGARVPDVLADEAAAALAPSQPTRVAYRAHPIVVGYALAALLFAGAAWSQRRRAALRVRDDGQPPPAAPPEPAPVELPATVLPPIPLAGDGPEDQSLSD